MRKEKGEMLLSVIFACYQNAKIANKVFHFSFLISNFSLGLYFYAVQTITI